MYLQKLRIWNFRKFGSGNSNLDLTKPDAEVPFTNGLNVLIGENDSGKTAIIDAIKLLLLTHSGEWIGLTQEDFYKDTDKLRIECRFENLRDNEAMHFTEWLGMSGEGKDAKPYLKVILEASKKGNEYLHYDIRAGADDEGHLLAGEARDYLRATYLKPLRDAKSELVPKRNSRLSQILSGHNAFKGKDDDHVLTKLSQCWDCLCQKYFNISHKPEFCKESTCPYQQKFYPDSGNVNEGEAIKNNLQSFISSFFGSGQYSATLTPAERELRHILEQLKLSLSDENSGLGSQNLLFIAAELLNLQRENWTGLRLALIEEIEAHLHPQAQMRVIEFFEQFVSENKTEKENKKEKEGQKDFQFIMTTHSPNLGSKINLENLIICHDGKVYPMGKYYTELDEPDYAFLERFLDVTKANLFFAKGVILVEGLSEELILPVLAKKIKRDLTQNGISIVNVGNTAFLRYAKIFHRRPGQESKHVQEMQIPVAVITDLDVQPDQESESPNGKTKKQNTIEAKEKKYNKQKVKTFVSPHWTLEYCIARSETLAPLLFQAVKASIKEMNQDGDSISDDLPESYNDFANGKNQDMIALEMYGNQILRKEQSRISKTILAQHFARIISEENISEEDLNCINSTKYLVDAIKHATA
jgi:putative ATP-dependent endonuclease of OLD family